MRYRRWLAVGVVLGAVAMTIVACIAHDLIACGDEFCPTSSVCTAGGCASPEAAASCAGLEDGTACSTPTFVDGTCSGGACYPSGCGNAIVDRGEVCDDGNTADRDQCSRDCRSNEVCGNQLIDLPVGEQCDVGVAGLSSDGCNSQCKVEFDLWRDITMGIARPRIHAPFVADSNGRLMLIGGSLGSSFSALGVIPEVLEWDGLTWRNARTITPLPPMTRSAAVYDSARRRVVLFGGVLESGLESGSTWEYDGVTWLDRTPASSPPARSNARLSFDPIRARVVMFGGEALSAGSGSAPISLGDTWEWDGTAWSMMSTTGPTPRILPAMSFDPETQTTLLFGGIGAGTGSSGTGSGSATDPVGDTWTWNGTTWTQVTTAVSPPFGAGVVCHDPASATMLLLTDANQTWQYEGAAWSQITTSAAPSGQLGALAVSPSTNVLTAYKPSGVHPWAGSNWSSVNPQQNPSSPSSMAFDAVRGRLVAAGPVTGGLWEWDGAAWERRFSGGGTASDAPLVYDSVHKVTLRFGGTISAAITTGFVQWDGTALTSIVAPVAPSGRRDHGMTFDARRGVAVLFGGISGPVPSSDTWIWDGTTWTQATPTIIPPGRSRHALAYDALRDRVVMFGGTSSGSGMPQQQYLDDTWEWDGTTWTQMPTAVRPAGRVGFLLVYDPRRERVVLAGGSNVSGGLTDTWEWDGAAWTERLTVVPIQQGAGVAAALDANGDVVTVVSNRIYRLRFESGLRPEQCGSATLDTDGDGLAGCADPDCWGRCMPSCLLGPCDPAGPRCGDAVCNRLLENYALCPIDCTGP